MILPWLVPGNDMNSENKQLSVVLKETCLIDSNEKGRN